MKIPDLDTPEGLALAVILSAVGEYGRDALRAHLLPKCDGSPNDPARVTLELLNGFEQGFTELERAKLAGRL